jgi:aromatic ring-cleaving dioxygenase
MLLKNVLFSMNNEVILPERQYLHNRRSTTCGQNHNKQTLPERQNFYSLESKDSQFKEFLSDVLKFTEKFFCIKK